MMQFLLFVFFFILCSHKQLQTLLYSLLCIYVQVSAVTDQPVQASAATSADLDDDEGGGLVCLSYMFFLFFNLNLFCIFSVLS